MPIGGLAADDPRRVGGYRLTGVLGRGGQASVYLGMGGDGRLVAVKVFGAEWLSREPESHDQIAAEVAALQAVPAFGIARLIAADPAANPPYLVSEYVPGATLAERVAAEGPLDPWAVERLALATLAALGAVHRVDLVHRDIKPGNIVLGPDGPRLIDFGIVERRGSREDVSDGVLGTRAFLAPELLDGVPADASGDMYAWAATIAYAATGRVPAGSDDALLGVPPGLADLVRRCLSHRAAERPTAAQALGHVLSAAAPSPLAAPATPAWGTPDGRAGTAPAPGVSRGAPPPASPPAAGPWRRQRHLSPPAPPRFLVLIQATRQRVRVARPRMQRQRVQRWEALLIVGATLVIPIVFGVEAWRSRPGVTSSRVAEFPAPTPTPSPTEPTEEAPEPEVSYPPLSPVKPRTDALQGTQIPVRTDGPGWAMPPVPSDDGSRIHLVERCRLSAWTTTRPTRIGTPTVLPARGTRCPTAISGDGRFLVTSGTGHLSMTDRRRARTTRLPAPDGLPVEIQIAADGRHLVGLVDRSTVASWDLEHPEKPPAAAGPPPPAAM